MNWWPKRPNKVHEEGETSPQVPEDQDWSFDVAQVNYINLDNVKSVLFTKLESSTSQRQTKMTYKIESGADGNLMPFKINQKYLKKL